MTTPADAWKDDVEVWMRSPVTRAYISILQREIRDSKEEALQEILAGKDGKVPAATTQAMRFAISEAFTVLANPEDYKDDEPEEAHPEELHPDRIADAVSTGSRR